MLSGRYDRSVVLAVATLGALAVLGACGDGGARPTDASLDTPIDMAPGTCAGADVLFTGEIIDWDWTNMQQCGVKQATLIVRGQTARTDSTNPNGRFDKFCIARQVETVVDLTFSMNASECGTDSRTYSGRGVLVAEQAVIAAGGFFSARAMTPERMATMFTAIGQPYNAAQGQLVVHVAGTLRVVSLSTMNHGATQQFNGTTWEPAPVTGAVGSYVWFPNVDLGGGPVTVSVAGAVGATAVTLEAGVFTYLTVIAN
jgi:hypothetical protein